MILDRWLEIAASIWTEVKNSSIPTDRWLGNFFHSQRKKFGSRDRRFYAETIYSLFRHKTFFEKLATELTPSNDPKLPVFLAATREDLIEESEILEYARWKNWPITAETIRKIRSEDLTSFPDWLVKRWQENFGMETCRSLMLACQERPPFVIRVNPVKITREKLVKKFEKQGFELRETRRSPYGIIFKERANLFDTEEFREGFFEVQDEGSQILCQLVDAKPGELVWDACAGGGGKTLLVAAMMQNKGRVIATDIRSKKLDELAKRAKRAGLFNIFPADINRMGEISQAKKGFDKILVDAPCSGTGTLRRNPDAKWKISMEKVLECRKDQLAILENVLPYLKKGGRLYYATCSLEPEENEQVMEEFFKLHPGMVRVPLPDGKESLRLFPHEHQTDGFFLAIAENK